MLSSPPTLAPTLELTARPTEAPTSTPSLTSAPSLLSSEPTTAPTLATTSTPSSTPLLLPPTLAPTLEPTARPSGIPTFTPSLAPFLLPPTNVPTLEPTARPTEVPTSAPSSTPSAPPTSVPTFGPTARPTETPTFTPSSAPLSSPPTSVPTLKPTARPTGIPTFTPSRAPTMAFALAPVISSVEVLRSENTSVKLSVTLESQPLISTITDFAGVLVYCVALTNGSTPTSIGAVKAASIDGSVSRGSIAPVPSGSVSPVKLSITINDLNALQTYAMYCYAETSSGTGNSLRAVIATRVTATTTCCKSITFTNAPPFVYSNVSRYSGSSHSLFVFKYALSSAPLGVLQVTPEVSLNGIKSTSIFVTPSSSIFLSKPPHIGQFYLSASLLDSANCTISLRLNGTNPAHYISSSTSVRLLSGISLLPAPSLLTSRFSDGGDNFLITFDSSTDKAGIVEPSWSCNTLFTFSGDSKALCTWVTASIVKASFPVVTDVTSSLNFTKVGDTVSIRSSTVRAFCTKTASACSRNPAATGTLLMLSPLNPVAPTVIITAPPTLGLCSNLTLDATGSYGHGGRLYKSVIWTVTANKNEMKNGSIATTRIQDYLRLRSLTIQVRKPIIVPRNYLETATYFFTLQLVNFFGLSTSSTVKVIVSDNSTVPLLTIIGPVYRTVFTSAPLTILSMGSLSTCATAIAVNYKWTVKLDGQLTPIVSSSRDPTTFSLPAHTLAVDKKYVIIITATAGTSSASASTKVYVSRGSLSAAVVGGYSRSIPVDKELVLNASTSTDTDVLLQNLTSLSYKVC